MAITLEKFTPLQYKHYQLAETQDEKDAAARRQMAIDNNRSLNDGLLQTMQEQNVNNRLNVANAMAREHQGLAQENYLNELDARTRNEEENTRRWDADFAMRQQAAGLASAAQSQSMANDNARLGLAMDANKRQQEEFNQSKVLRDQQIAMANFASHLSMLSPDEQGNVDISNQKDNIEKLVGGFDNPYKKITAQNRDGKTLLFGWDGDKATQLTRNGTPVAINNNYLEMMSRFGGNAKSEDKNIKDNYIDVGSTDDMGVRTTVKVDPRTGETFYFDPESKSVKRGQIGEQGGEANEAQAVGASLMQSRQQQPSGPFQGGLAAAVANVNAKPAMNSQTQQGVGLQAQPSYKNSNNPGEVLDSLRYANKLTNEDERSLGVAAKQGQKALDARILAIRDRITRLGY